MYIYIYTHNEVELGWFATPISMAYGFWLLEIYLNGIANQPRTRRAHIAGFACFVGFKLLDR